MDLFYKSTKKYLRALKKKKTFYSLVNFFKHYYKLSIKLKLIFLINNNIIFEIVKTINSFINTIKYRSQTTCLIFGGVRHNHILSKKGCF